MADTINKKTNLFLWLLGTSVFVVIGSSIYNLYIKKNYDFIVETSCDPLTQICFERDCSNADNCPPNQLSDFKRFKVKAADFSKCENEDCSVACESGLISCVPMACVPDEILGESCSSVHTTE